MCDCCHSCFDDIFQAPVNFDANQTEQFRFQKLISRRLRINVNAKESDAITSSVYRLVLAQPNGYLPFTQVNLGVLN